MTIRIRAAHVLGLLVGACALWACLGVLSLVRSI